MKIKFIGLFKGVENFDGFEDFYVNNVIPETLKVPGYENGIYQFTFILSGVVRRIGRLSGHS